MAEKKTETATNSEVAAETPVPTKVEKKK
ncbi:MAG: hypothetical protein RIR71_40, partial [Actinomycetota bacterium]